jgi:hypothetical protein
MYHVILLPSSAPESQLVGLTNWQAMSNQLPACLVLTPDRAIYFETGGRCFLTQEPPLGGFVVTGGLVAAVDCGNSTDEFQFRQRRLAAVVEAWRRAGGIAFGDVSKGGHRATEDERRRLEGWLPDGTPRGLRRCETCDDWTGVCLDPSPQFAGMIMAVSCFCDNRNRCARCAARLYERRLNANYYNPRDRTIWHVPGFSGLRHRCSPQSLCMANC